MQEEEKLESDVAAERQAAAATLGDLRYIYSYEPLLHALERESGSGYGKRDMKAAILRALENIGADHSCKPELRAGREPLNRFMIAHLADAELVESALKALVRTGIPEETLDDLDKIKNAARAAGYRETVSAASDIYFDIITSR